MLFGKTIATSEHYTSLLGRARIMTASLGMFKDYAPFAEKLVKAYGGASPALELLVSTTLRTRHRLTWNDTQCSVFAEAVSLTDHFPYEKQAELLTIALRKARHLCTLTDTLSLAREVPQEYFTERFVTAFSSAVVRYFSLRVQRYAGIPQKKGTHRDVMLTAWQKKIRPDRRSIELQKDIQLYTHCFDLMQRTPHYTWQWPHELFMHDEFQPFLRMLNSTTLENMVREIFPA